MNAESTHEAGFWECVRADCRDIRGPYDALLTLLGCAPIHAVLIHRLAHALKLRRVRMIPNLLRMLNRMLHHCDINIMATIGPGFRLPHPTGVMLGGMTVIGRNCTVYQNVTMGGGGTPRSGRSQPVLGDNVTIQPGTILSGGVAIGDGATVGPRSVVTRDIPTGCYAAGLPARVISEGPNQ